MGRELTAGFLFSFYFDKGVVDWDLEAGSKELCSAIPGLAMTMTQLRAVAAGLWLQKAVSLPRTAPVLAIPSAMADKQRLAQEPAPLVSAHHRESLGLRECAVASYLLHHNRAKALARKSQSMTDRSAVLHCEWSILAHVDRL